MVKTQSRHTWIAVIALFVTLFIGCKKSNESGRVKTPATKTIHITAQVNDEAGSAVPDVQILISGAARGVSDSEGKVEIIGIPVNRDQTQVQLTFEKEGYVPADRMLTLEAENTNYHLDVPMKKIPFLPVLVFAKAESPSEVLEPLAGATIYVDGQMSGTTDKTGKWVVPLNPDAQTVTLKVVLSDGFDPKRFERRSDEKQITLEDGHPQPSTVSFAFTRLIQLNLRFHFQDAETSEGVQGVASEVNGVKVQKKSNRAGELATSLYGKSTERANFVFTREGYFDTHFSMHFPVRDSDEVGTIPLSPEYTLNAQVKTHDGQPLEGVEVSTGELSTQTDPVGHATLRLSRFNETEDLNITKLGWKPVEKVLLRERQKRTWLLQGVMTPYREMTAIVRPEGAKEKTLAAVEVYALDRENHPIQKLGRTGVDGKFQVTLTQGFASLLFDKGGYEKTQVNISADARDDTFEVVMQPLRKVKVKIIAKSAERDEKIPATVQIDKKEASPEMEYEVGYHQVTVVPKAEGYQRWEGTVRFDPPKEGAVQTVTIALGSDSYDRGHRLEQANQIEAAMAEYQKILSPKHPDYSAAHSRLGALHAEAGNYRAAILEFQKVVNLPQNGGDALGYYNLGYALYYANEYSAAREAFGKVMTYHQNLPDDRYHEVLYYTYYHLALANEKIHEALLKQDRIEAERHLREAGQYWQRFYEHLPPHFAKQPEYQRSLKRAAEHSTLVQAQLNR